MVGLQLPTTKIGLQLQLASSHPRGALSGLVRPLPAAAGSSPANSAMQVALLFKRLWRPATSTLHCVQDSDGRRFTVVTMTPVTKCHSGTRSLD
jgi:hypothetical protein